MILLRADKPLSFFQNKTPLPIPPCVRAAHPGVDTPCLPARSDSGPPCTVQELNIQLSGSKHIQLGSKMLKTGHGGSPTPRPLSGESEQPRPRRWMENLLGGRSPRPPEQLPSCGRSKPSPPPKIRSLTGVIESVGQVEVTLTCGGHRGCKWTGRETSGVLVPGCRLLPSTPPARAKPHRGLGAKVSPPRELSRGSQCLHLPPVCLSDEYLIFPSSWVPLTQDTCYGRLLWHGSLQGGKNPPGIPTPSSSLLSGTRACFRNAKQPCVLQTPLGVGCVPMNPPSPASQLSQGRQVHEQGKGGMGCLGDQKNEAVGNCSSCVSTPGGLPGGGDV